MRFGTDEQHRGGRRLLVVSAALAIGASSPLTGPSAAEDEQTQTDGQNGPVTPLEAVEDPEDAGSERLTWGVVPSGPDGPTGRARFELEVAPGETLVDHVGVINYTFDEQTFDVYAQDAFTTEQGGFDILPAADSSTGAGTWLEIDVSQVTVPPRSRVDVPFRLAVPANATPGDHALGIVASSTSEMVDEDGSRVAVDRRVGARVYVRVAGDLDPGLTIERLDAVYQHRLNPFARSAVTFEYRITNTGNVRLAGDPTMSTRWLFGWSSTEGTGERLPELLPGESFTATGELTGVTPLMWLYADLEVLPVPPENGAETAVTAAVATVVVWAIPWTLLALVFVGVGCLAYLRRRRSPGSEPAAGRGGHPDGERSPASGSQTGGSGTSEPPAPANVDEGSHP